MESHAHRLTDRAVVAARDGWLIDRFASRRVAWFTVALARWRSVRLRQHADNSFQPIQPGGTNAVGAAAGDAGRGVADKLGIKPGMVVQELGWDEDVDDDLRAAVEEQCGSELLDDDADEVVDIVLLWWRDGDGDLVDALVDAIGPLADNGVVWVLTPKTGTPGHVEPSEIAEAAPTAGLSQTSNISVADAWTGARLVAPRTAKSRR
jgi:hypothetical protein